MVSSINGFEIIGEAENAEIAISGIPDLSPDIILLDIQMPGKNGFELLEALDQVPQVIFVTAYNQYAVKAFEVNALDYLTKPVDSTRLEIALQKAQKTISEESETVEQERELMSEDARVFVKDGEKCWFVRLGDISLFEADGNYTQLFFNNDKPRINKSLTYLEERLDEATFFRANRSQMINLKHIDRVDPWFSKSIKITLINGMEIELSRRQTQLFKEIMSF
jgi:two-component system LytT family response regulator